MIYIVKCFAKIKEYSTEEHSLFNPFMYFVNNVSDGMFRGMLRAKSELFCINDIHFFNKVG